MFGPAGHAYVYRSYGIHWCLNAVCEAVGTPAAVLVRAIVPEHGRDAIRLRRPGREQRDWCRGPGRLCAALGVDRALDGRPLDAPPFELRAAPRPLRVETATRVGITRATERPWRFVAADCRFVSVRAR